MPYQSIFGTNGPNPALGGKANPYAGDFTPGKYAAINAQIAASQPARKVVTPAYNPKASLFNRLAGGLANIVTPTTKGQKAATKSNDASQSKLLSVLNNPNIPLQRKQGSYRALVGDNSPSMAAANTKMITQATNPANIPKTLAQSVAGPLIDKLNQNIVPLFNGKPSGSSIIDIQKGAKAAVKAGKFSPETVGLINKYGGNRSVMQAVADPSASDKSVQKAIKLRQAYESTQNKQALGESLLLTSLVAGGGETAGLSKGAALAKGLAVNTGAAAAGNVGNTLANNPNATGKQLVKSGIQGAPFGAVPTLLGAGANAVKNGLKDVKKASLESVSTPATLIPKGGAKLMNTAIENPEFNQAINKTPNYTKQVEDTLSKVKQAGTGNTAKGAVGELKSLFTPGKDTKGVQTDLRAATGDLALKTSQEGRSAADSVKFFAKQKTGDNLNFIQKISSGVKQDSPELQKAAQGFRTQFEQDYQLAKELKPDLPHLDNYFAQSGIWKDPKQAEDFAKRFQTPSLGGKPGALEQRSFPTIYDGIKAGLQVKEANPAVIALNNRASLLKAKMAQDFLEEQSAKGIDPSIVQRTLDRYLQPGLQGSDVYKSAKDAAYALNNLQLSLSGFHVAGTALNATFSEFSNGLQDVLRGHPLQGAKSIVGSTVAPLKYILNGNQILKDLRAGNITKDISNIAEGGGRIGTQFDYQSSGLRKSLDEIHSGQAIKGIAAAPLRAVSDVAKPVMEWWVPRIKAGATKALIDRKVAELGSGASQEAIRAAEAEAIDSIDNRFGQLVQDNLFWNKKVKDISKVLMRSPGWNIGTVREVGGGAKDLLMPSTYKALAKGQGISERSSYTLSLAAGTALIGTALSYLYTGKGPSSPIDYFYPKTGKVDKNGNNERVSLPTYAKDIFAFAHDPVQTAANKANPLISEGMQVASNKDYYGNQVRNPNDSLATQAKQAGKYLVKSNLPFSISSSSQRVDKGLSTKVQSFFGLNPAPGYVTKSPFEQQVQNKLTQALGNKPLTPEEQDKIAAAPAKSGTQLSRQFSYLLKADRPAAAQIINQAKPADIQKLGDLKSILQDLAYNTQNDKSKQATRDASSKLLQVLNKQGYNTDELTQQKKAAIKAKARQTRLNKAAGR